MIYLELQRGKKGMAEAKYNDQMIKTAACTARLIEGTKSEEPEEDESIIDSDKEREEKEKDTYLADAWFGSVPAVIAAMNLGCHLICVVKTCTNRYPKAWLEQKMKLWQPGSHLLLEAKIEGKKMFACRYKYSMKKVLCFLFGDGAGHTEEGEPYVACWKD